LNKKDARQHNQAICTPPPCGAVVFLAGEWSARRGALIGERSRRARLLLRQRLEHVVLREELHGHDGPPLVARAPEDEKAKDAWYDAQAGLLADRWIGAGLDALLRVRAAQLAPGLDRPAPLLDVVEVLAATHLETFGPGVFPLPLCRCPPLPKSRQPPCARPRWPHRWPRWRLTLITWTRHCWSWR
jgi:hypothetical protein